MFGGPAGASAAGVWSYRAPKKTKIKKPAHWRFCKIIVKLEDQGLDVPESRSALLFLGFGFFFLLYFVTFCDTGERRILEIDSVPAASFGKLEFWSWRHKRTQRI